MMTCAFSLVPHLFLHNVRFADTIWMGVGVVLGAQAGAAIATRLRSKTIMALFALILLVFAARLFFTSSARSW